MLANPNYHCIRNDLYVIVIILSFTLLQGPHNHLKPLVKNTVHISYININNSYVMLNITWKFIFLEPSLDSILCLNCNVGGVNMKEIL